ncbi:MAG: hypothetical protein WC708_10045 [Lentisphaeria bacterium]
MLPTRHFCEAIAALSLLLSGQRVTALDGMDLARIELHGDSGVNLTVLENSPNSVAAYQNWGDPATRHQRLVVESPTHEKEWRNAWVKFVSSKDGYVSLSLLGPWLNLGGGTLGKVQVLYDCVSLDGASVADGSFEKGGAWSMAPDCILKDRSLSLSGENCVIVWHNSPAKQRIQVSKGTPVTLSFSFRRPPPPSSPITRSDTFCDFSTSANMGFKDDVAGDGKGGWSDQGPDNDLALFDVEHNFFGAVPFKIIDPAKNEGKSVLTFASPKITPAINLKTATIKTNGAMARYLYILHACCWSRSVENDLVGEVSVTLRKGASIRKFPIRDKRDVGDWWYPANLPNGAVAFTQSNGKSDVGLFLSKFKISDSPVEVESVTFKTAGGPPVWIVVGATLSNESYALPITGHFIAKDSPEWKAADMSTVVVKPGSALDLSGVIPTEPVGTYGRVIVNKEGNFAFEKKPDANIVFLSCAFGDRELVKYKTKGEIRAIVEAIRRQGYNMVRGHFLDFYLMEGGKADFDFNEENLDRFDYFVSCLKERGIYMYFDAVTSWSAFKKGSGWSMQGVDFKRDIMALPEAREHWRLGVTKILTHMNPYTKTRLVDDPVIAIMLFYNELEFYSYKPRNWNDGLHPALVGEWQAWLRQHYNNDASALARAWGDPTHFTSEMKFEDIPLFSGSAQLQTTPYGIDAGLFMIDIETKISAWFEDTVRAIGYKGLTTLWDMCKLYRNDVSRAGIQVIAMHNYQAHPQGPWVSKGQVVDQSSSFATLAGYWRDVASTRYANRPLFVSEYGHAFWSRTRYEEGLLFGAYSALQGFQGLMVHAAPVCLVVRNPIKPFDAGSDPVERANQVITAFLFGRQDVSPSRRYIELRFDDKFLLEHGHLNQAPGAENLFALICKFGIWYDNAKTRGGGVKPRPITVINASGGAKTSMTDNTMDVIGSDSAGKQKISDIIARLKRHGLLPQENRSDPARPARLYWRAETTP